LSKNKALHVLNDYKGKFSNNDTSDNCQISSYKLIFESDLSDYNGEIVTISYKNIEIFPSKSINLKSDETLSLYLQAETNGFKKEKFLITIDLLSNESNEADLPLGP
jgi:hypothetical protein